MQGRSAALVAVVIPCSIQAVACQVKGHVDKQAGRLGDVPVNGSGAAGSQLARTATRVGCVAANLVADGLGRVTNLGQVHPVGEAGPFAIASAIGIGPQLVDVLGPLVGVLLQANTGICRVVHKEGTGYGVDGGGKGGDGGLGVEVLRRDVPHTTVNIVLAPSGGGQRHGDVQHITVVLEEIGGGIGGRIERVIAVQRLRPGERVAGALLIEGGRVSAVVAGDITLPTKGAPPVDGLCRKKRIYKYNKSHLSSHKKSRNAPGSS